MPSGGSPIVVVHGIFNFVADKTPDEAGLLKAAEWEPALAAGYRAAGLDAEPPSIVAPYYADLLAAHAQGGPADLAALPPDLQELAWSWMLALGVPQETAQGTAARPLRQGVDWLARRRNVAATTLSRVMIAVLPEVFRYLSRPALREQARARVIAAVEEHRPRVVVGHSLGSVVTYEALHSRPDLPVELLVTLGSPLGLPDVFAGLQPAPVDGRGARPASVGRWVNIADPGDIVAVPAELGGRFDVDLHGEAPIHPIGIHRLGQYLSCGLTAVAIQPYT